jgi:hypothetical protein
MYCQLGQGYLFSKPLSKETVDELIQTIHDFSQKHPEQAYPLGETLSN